MVCRYSLIVFDWEGTLGDSLGEILNSILEEARRLGYEEPPASVTRQYCVLSLPLAIRKMFPRLNQFQLETLQRSVQNRLISQVSAVCLFPGAEAMLQKINEAGISLAIASNKGMQSLRRVLNSSGLQPYFSVTRCASEAPPKPCPQMLEEILTEFSCPPQQVLMVGDSVADIEMAKTLGVDALGVDFYQQNKDILRAAGAVQVIDHFGQLITFLGL